MMKRIYIFLLAALTIWSCDKSDNLLGGDDSFTHPDTDQSGVPSDTDDPNYIKLRDYRTYVFAGATNLNEESMLTAAAAAPVKYSFEPVFIPEGDVVDKGNYSMEKPMALRAGNESVLFFKRSLNGSSNTNLASGWCVSSRPDGATEWSAITEIRKFAPYGYSKGGAFAVGVSSNQVYCATKGVLLSDGGTDNWLHYPEALQWSQRNLSAFNPDIGGDVLPNVMDTDFGLMMMTESYATTIQELVIAEIKYDTLDMDGSIPIYGTTPVDTVFAYTSVQEPNVASLVVSSDGGQSWTDYPYQVNDTLHLLAGTSLSVKQGAYRGSIINVGYDLTKRRLNQCVYRYNDADDIADTLVFQSHATNITNDSPIGLSTPELIYNPVTGKIELIEAFTNQLIVWSIGLDEIFAGNSSWTKECILLHRGVRYADFADTYAVGSIIDEINGVQEIYLSMGAKNPSRKAIYRLTRDLNTPQLANWISTARVSGK